MKLKKNDNESLEHTCDGPERPGMSIEVARQLLDELHEQLRLEKAFDEFMETWVEKDSAADEKEPASPFQTEH